MNPSMLENYGLEDLIEALALKELTKATYGACLLPTPDALNEDIAQLGKKIKDRRKDFLMAKQKTILARLEQLKTSEEKKVDLAADLARINEALKAE